MALPISDDASDKTQHAYLERGVPRPTGTKLSKRLPAAASYSAPSQNLIKIPEAAVLPCRSRCKSQLSPCDEGLCHFSETVSKPSSRNQRNRHPARKTAGFVVSET